MERAILYVEIDSFYATMEQNSHPEWKGPLAVTSDGFVSCINAEAATPPHTQLTFDF